MRYLVDTDVIIDGLHGQHSSLALLEQLAPDGLSVSMLSLGELYEGAYLSQTPEEHLDGINQFLAGYRVLGLDAQTMNRFAQERAALRRQGLLIPDFDLLIASTALTNHLVLVTRNRRQYERISEIRLRG